MNTDNPSQLPNSGVVSLISDFSVNCVLEGGRISLAHLIEFSHFIDLYVLEDLIYIDAASKSVGLASLSVDQDCPFRELPGGNLTEAVFQVSDSTRAIYDCSEVKYSFSMDGYDYWLHLRDAEKSKVPEWYGNVKYFSRDALLIESRRLTESINTALDEVAKTRLTLVPSSRNLLPFLDVFHQMETPTQLIYRQLTASQRKLVAEVQALTRPRTVFLPPLLSVLLNRCETASDILPRLCELRLELKDFRQSISNWFKTFDEAATIREKMQIREELERSINSVIQKFHSDRLGFYKEIAANFIEGAGEGDLKKALVKPTLTLLKKGATTALPDLLATRRLTGLVGLMDEALRVNDYSSQLTRIFGERLDISQREISHAKQYRQQIISKYGFDIPAPL